LRTLVKRTGDRIIGLEDWSRDGRHLVSASFVSAPLPEVGTPAPLFKTDVLPTHNLDQYAPAPDGQRFLLKMPAGTGEQSLLNVVVNWTTMLTGR